MQGEPVKILVVEDEPSVRRIVVSQMEHAGYQVEEAETAEQALQILKAYRPLVIITDLIMPGMNGLDFVTEVRRKPDMHDCYILVLTGKDRTQDVLDGFAASADDYLTKPFLSAELTARVGAAVRIKTIENELRDTNARLRQALSDYYTLLGTVVHDLRQPLSIISSYLNLLGSENSDISTASVQQVCQERAQSMRTVLDQVLDLQQIAAGEIKLDPQRADVTPLAREAVELYQPLASHQDLHLHAECPDELTMFVDYPRLSSILHTLLEETIQYASTGSDLVLSVFRSEGQVHFTITAHGARLQTLHAELNHEFSLANNAQTFARHPGSLGLVILRCIVERMTGKVFHDWREAEESIAWGITLPAPSDDSLEKARQRLESGTVFA